MTDPHELPFTDLAQSLFSAEEMRALMRSEIARAQRYGFPLTLFLVGVDRLDALHDLYGVASKSEILTTVLDFLRRQVRASDLVGSLQGDRLLLLSPYADRAGSKQLAQRMLAGARGLRFASDNRDLQVTLSIGMAHAARPDPQGLGALFRAADDAQRLALRNGGDRVLEIDLLDAEADPVPEDAEARPRGASRPAASERPAPSAPPEEDAQPAAAAGPSPSNPLGGLAPEDVVTVVREALAQLGLDASRLGAGQESPGEAPPAREAAAPAAERGRGTSEVELQDRRIAKLASAVEGLQAQLAALAQGGAAPDQGVASLGKVFGALGQGDEDDDKRKELMGALFRANLSLQKRRAEAERES